MKTIKLSTMMSGVVRSLVKTGYSKEKIDHAAGLASDYEIDSIHRDGNFTVVIVGNHTGRNHVGVSKLHPKDANDDYRGVCIAASRALANTLVDLSGDMVKHSLDNPSEVAV